MLWLVSLKPYRLRWWPTVIQPPLPLGSCGCWPCSNDSAIVDRAFWWVSIHCLFGNFKKTKQKETKQKQKSLPRLHILVQVYLDDWPVGFQRKVGEFLTRFDLKFCGCFLSFFCLVYSFIYFVFFFLNLIFINFDCWTAYFVAECFRFGVYTSSVSRLTGFN